MGGRSDEQEYNRLRQFYNYMVNSAVDLLFLAAIIAPILWIVS